MPLSPQAAHRASIDWQEAIEACTQAVAEAPQDPYFGFLLGRAFEQMKNYPEAAQRYQTAGDASSTQALKALGLLYYKGLGIVVSKEKAFMLFPARQKPGTPCAMQDVGVMFGNGEFVKRDDAKALEWFAKAEAAGDAGALGQVGTAYFYGRGSPVDYLMAAHYFQQAADLGDGYSMKFLAIMYERGLLGPPDLTKAISLRARAQEVDPVSDSPDVPLPRTASGGHRGSGSGTAVGGRLAPGPRHGVIAPFVDPDANNQFYKGTVTVPRARNGIPTALPLCWPICTVR